MISSCADAGASFVEESEDGGSEEGGSEEGGLSELEEVEVSPVEAAGAFDANAAPSPSNRRSQQIAHPTSPPTAPSPSPALSLPPSFCNAETRSSLRTSPSGTRASPAIMRAAFAGESFCSLPNPPIPPIIPPRAPILNPRVGPTPGGLRIPRVSRLRNCVARPGGAGMRSGWPGMGGPGLEKGLASGLAAAFGLGAAAR
ncbi:hypothetical protein DFH07DRAFT_827962 [Mycena maculata]|uniref:Uncharacterized protein n=1 Tax=Mycena maculata TaxID=230809 RepID=A0AAD7IX16_9AGAR|nr:hypothetical protein DFH07DRAFT_827962 [Mycena maculata]